MGEGERGGSGIWEGVREGGGKSLDRFRDDDDGSKLRSVARLRVDYSIDKSMLFSFTTTMTRRLGFDSRLVEVCRC